jgi:uncharacterized protein YdeI (YjbR/CyaY-like superfamily)
LYYKNAPMAKNDERIDAYIANSADFAQPILTHIRKLVHVACPSAEETIKWGFPTFLYQGAILCSMASFKQHCTFTFWKGNLMGDPHKILTRVGNTDMAGIGNIHVREDLPSDKILKEYIKGAMRLNGEITGPPAKKATKRKDLNIPAYLTAALKNNKKALAAFEAFSACNKNEYIEWLEEAKTDATRQKRLLTAIEWISEGKPRNWKYMKK